MDFASELNHRRGKEYIRYVWIVFDPTMGRIVRSTAIILRTHVLTRKLGFVNFDQYVAS